MASNPLGLANQDQLNKIDQLRELNVKSIELPQLVVLGDQSSGKSSVLESLTGFSFPQAPGLCTRYATQISCRREAEDSVTVSIIPRQDADAATETRLRAFKRNICKLTNDALVQIIQDANTIMGIRMTPEEPDHPDLCTFSNDTLRIEICGPEQEHFTVIDVPGIFRVASPPFTTDADVELVRNMVESYIENSRTIILAVLPSNIDITTQEILKMAEKADPGGVRTMGVLTKPDLVTEVATQKAIRDLVLGKGKQLRLGYCVVKNRSADDAQSSLSERIAQEQEFFGRTEWREIAHLKRCGIGSLKTRLAALLMDITKKGFPHVKAEVVRRLEQLRNELDNMGPARTEQSAQRMYLGRLGSRFQAVTQCALNGCYDSEGIFTQVPGLKLITDITKMNERFANLFWKKGHKRHTSLIWDDEGEAVHALPDDDDVPAQSVLPSYPELQDIVSTDGYVCAKPSAFKDDSIMEHIEKIYQLNRGPELGTFSGAILSATFKEQSSKWESLVLAHVSATITRVHDYISTLLQHICPDTHVRTQLWDKMLVDELRRAYTRATTHARFLLGIEVHGRPCTFNHYFNAELQKRRQERVKKAAEAASYTASGVRVVALSSLHAAAVVNRENAQQVREDILDVLMSYYKVSRKRFVDNICTQVVGHFLLDGEQSPLRIFSSELVMGLDDEQLEMIAGEDTETRCTRSQLVADIKTLEAAMKVLRT